jgi:hypothetical protein
MPRFLPSLRARSQGKAPLRRRPRLECLEDRATPSVGLDFVPFSTVAVNPSPVPPTALVQFNPVPDLFGIPGAGAMFQDPIHLQGTFHQTLTAPSATAGPARSTPVVLDIVYNLTGSDSGAAVPADPTTATPGHFAAEYNLAGTVTETLTIPAASATVLPTVWAIMTRLTENGTVTGPLNRIVTGTPVVDEMTFDSTIGLTQVQRKLSTTSAGSTPWSVQSDIQSTGKFEVNPVPPPTTTAGAVAVVTTPFTLQNQITESLAPVPATSAPPPAPIKVTAVDNAAGTVTKYMRPLANSTAPLFLTGATQYRQQLTETITIPPSPTQPGYSVTVSQPFDTTGVFQSVNVLPPVPAADSQDSGGGPLTLNGPGAAAN